MCLLSVVLQSCQEPLAHCTVGIPAFLLQTAEYCTSCCIINRGSCDLMPLPKAVNTRWGLIAADTHVNWQQHQESHPASFIKKSHGGLKLVMVVGCV